MGLYCPLTGSAVEAVSAMRGALGYPTEEGLLDRAVSLLLITPSTHFVCDFVGCSLLF